MKEDVPSLKTFLATHNLEIPLEVFFLNLVLVVVLAELLRIVFVRFGHSLSDRAAFARTFAPVAATTMLIIVLVKTSLALSLGLVGALSIVRFRTAIKEPEELAYLFLCIAVGVGGGADHRVITVVAFAVVTLTFIIRGRRRGLGSAMLLALTFRGGARPEVDQLVAALSGKVRSLDLRRYDHSSEGVDVLFAIQLRNAADIGSLEQAVRALDAGASFSLLESGR